jgi:SAM-dependent methyltransferase
MDEVLYDEMYRLESTHWWFVAKRRIVLSLLRKFLPVGAQGPAPLVCDIGCGCGMTLRALQDLGYDALGVDVSDTALAYCAARGVKAIKGSLPGGVDLPPGSADALLMLDVLEHLDDDHAGLLTVMDLLRPGGLLIATVPACPWLWTRHDEFHHHRRRYSMRSWRQTMDRMTACTGSRGLLLSYFNTYLFPLVALERLARRILHVPHRAGDLSVPPAGINRILTGIFASERLLLCKGLSLPVGLSLLAVVRKSPADASGRPKF